MQTEAEIHRIDGAVLIIGDDLSGAVFAVLQQASRPPFVAVSVTDDGVFLVDDQDGLHHLVGVSVGDAAIAVGLNVLRVREVHDFGTQEHDVEYAIRNGTLENEPELSGMTP